MVFEYDHVPSMFHYIIWPLTAFAFWVGFFFDKKVLLLAAGFAFIGVYPWIEPYLAMFFKAGK